jgi:hypothetical protein
MARLKSIRIKSKEFVFEAYGNNKEDRPAKIIFSRFPILGETFVPMDKKSIFDGIDAGKLSQKDFQKDLMSKIGDKIIENFLSNLQAGAVDYKQFFSECVDRFEDFEYGQSKIITANDFWQILPAEAAAVIALEAHNYAQERDEFTMGE